MLAIIEAKRDEIEALCRTHRVRRLLLFGSAAREHDFDPEHSDLDFLVEFEPMGPHEYADHFDELSSALESLFGREVDLVSIKSIRNPYLIQAIRPDRITLYDAA